MKRNLHGRRDIRSIIIFLSIIFVVAIIDYRVFSAKSRDIVLYDDFNGHLGSVRVSITKLEYLLDMFVVAGRFENATVDIIKDDVGKLDTEINSGLLNPKYEEILRGNAMLSDGLASIADDWHVIKIEIRRLNVASSPDEVRLIHDAVDMNTVSLIDKAEKLLSVTAEGRNRVFADATVQALLSIIGFILVNLAATLYVYKRYLQPLKAAARVAALAASGERRVSFNDTGGYMGALGAQLNLLLKAWQAVVIEKDNFIAGQTRVMEEHLNQMDSVGQILKLAGRSLSQSDMISSVVREAVAVGGADAVALYLNDGAGLALKGASGFNEAVFNDGAALTYSFPGDGDAHAVMRLYERVEDFPDNVYARLMDKLGFAALAVIPVRFNDASFGVLVAAYKDAACAAAAPAPFFESLAAALGASAGYTGLYHNEMRSRRFFERIVSQLPYGVAVFKRDGTCVLCNGGFHAIMGSGPVCEYRLLDDASLKASGALDSLICSFDGYPAEVTVDYDPSEFFVKYGFTGHSKTLRIKSYPLFDTDGEITNIVLVYEDLSSGNEALGNAASGDI
ncbi:MAG: hypothetical protein HZB85_09600 [Deltaproteobacteria bacterium]|nr:hypothetical protein [Deltaproteobacteria bacterium]